MAMNEERHKRSACPCCDSPELTDHYYKTLKCQKCGHAWFPEELIKIEPSELYGESYFQGNEYPDYLGDEESLKLNFRKYCKKIIKVNSKGSKLLEIGCAYGFFLDVAKNYFDVMGVDVSEDVIKKARDRHLNVICADFAKHPPKLPPLDIICLWDTIEHLLHPLDYLKMANQKLNKGGHLFLTTSDVSSFLAKVQGSNWRQYHPPTHVHYFSRKSLKMALEKAGFKTQKISVLSQWHSLKHILGAFRIHGRTSFSRKTAKFLEKLCPKLLNKFSFPVPTTDILWVHGIKM